MTLINWLFFWNVDMGFYILGLVQRSFWMMDGWWSIFPSIYGLLWAFHPIAMTTSRVLVANIMTAIWAIRLTHTYLRREEWKFGTREDWRYT